MTTYEDGIAAGEIAAVCQSTEEGRGVREVMDRVGDKWTMLVVSTLAPGTLRFTDIKRQIPGISQRMLTLTLRQLERDGLVGRTVHAEVPPRVEYELTGIGRTLIEPVDALARWAIENHPAIRAHRAAFDRR